MVGLKVCSIRIGCTFFLAYRSPAAKAYGDGTQAGVPFFVQPKKGTGEKMHLKENFDLKKWC
jgi:hypothetical protein